MTYFNIAGPPNCPFYGHALYVADFLEGKLPNFHSLQWEIPAEKWNSWLRDKNLENRWHHTGSPLVWKNLTKSGSRPHYVGGLSEFWEYCYDYYNLEFVLPKSELKNIVEDSMQYFNKEQLKPIAKEETMSVLIASDSVRMTAVFLYELFQLKIINKQKRLTVYLYNIIPEVEYLNEIYDEIHGISMKAVLDLHMISFLEDGLVNCNLFIIFGDMGRREDETFNSWLYRNNRIMLRFAEKINSVANKTANDLRIILAMHGPVCFNATILAKHCPSINICDIVAVTSDVGLEALKLLAEETNTSMSTLGGPPVWGFVGINHFIDIDHIVQKYDVYRPYKRAIDAGPESTLVSGTKHTEIRFFTYKSYELKDFWRKAKDQVDIRKRYAIRLLPKIRATISIIDNWYSEEENPNIISLGILSDGYTVPEIPKAVCYSLPVKLNNGKWEPVIDFPQPLMDIHPVKDFIPFVMETLEPYISKS